MIKKLLSNLIITRISDKAVVLSVFMLQVSAYKLVGTGTQRQSSCHASAHYMNMALTAMAEQIKLPCATRWLNSPTISSVPRLVLDLICFSFGIWTIINTNKKAGPEITLLLVALKVPNFRIEDIKFKKFYKCHGLKEYICTWRYSTLKVNSSYIFFFFQESFSDLSSLNFTNNQKHYDNLAVSVLILYQDLY